MGLLTTRFRIAECVFRADLRRLVFAKTPSEFRSRWETCTIRSKNVDKTDIECNDVLTIKVLQAAKATAMHVQSSLLTQRRFVI